jgi:predicted acylesterase/phospholipase RssA
VTPKLRLAVTLPGAVSLGSYEGGAMAALLVAIQSLQREEPPVVLDVVAGSSAGAITGLLATRTLLNGLDPVYVMREAWVVAPDLDAMLDGATTAPLCIDPIADSAGRLLEADGHRDRPVQHHPIRLHMALANLRGIDYEIELSDGRPPVTGVTHEDWDVFRFEPNDPLTCYTEPKGGSALDSALASAAHPIAFPPVSLDRSANAQRRESCGRDESDLDHPQGREWYIDGGAVDNQPVGRTLELLRELGQAGAGRIVLLIHPGDPHRRELSPNVKPTWVQTWRGGDNVARTRMVIDDLRRVRLLLASEGNAMRVEEIEPSAIAAAMRPPADDAAILRGESIGRFAGFLGQRHRRCDFDVGYRAATAWLESLRGGGLLVDADIDIALQAIRSRHQPGPLIAERSRVVPRVRELYGIGRSIASLVRANLPSAAR